MSIGVTEGPAAKSFCRSLSIQIKHDSIPQRTLFHQGPVPLRACTQNRNTIPCIPLALTLQVLAGTSQNIEE